MLGGGDEICLPSWSLVMVISLGALGESGEPNECADIGVLALLPGWDSDPNSRPNESGLLGALFVLHLCFSWGSSAMIFKKNRVDR